MNWFMGLFAAVVVMFIVGMIGLNVYAATKTGTVTIVVTGKERGSSDKPTLVFAEDGTYMVGDSLFDGQFTSSDLYGKITVGKTYTCDTRGIRNGLLSMWPNLVDCTEEN